MEIAPGAPWNVSQSVASRNGDPLLGAVSERVVGETKGFDVQGEIINKSIGWRFNSGWKRLRRKEKQTKNP